MPPNSFDLSRYKSDCALRHHIKNLAEVTKLLLILWVKILDGFIVSEDCKKQLYHQTIQQSLSSYFFNPEFDNTRRGLYFCNIAYLFAHNTFSYWGTDGNFTKL